MIEYFDFIREFNILSIALRMILAIVCGGVIGMEREMKRRSAGFRTHILICLGAAMTILTSEYLSISGGYTTDLTRIGAQVVAGIGFIGAGTIIVTKRRRVKGLTTAAGLWASAIIGLTCGAGFVEASLCATVLILLTEVFFFKLEQRIVHQSREINLYVEYVGQHYLDEIIRKLRILNVRIIELEIAKNHLENEGAVSAIFTLHIPKKHKHGDIINEITAIDGVTGVEEL